MHMHDSAVLVGVCMLLLTLRTLLLRTLLLLPLLLLLLLLLLLCMPVRPGVQIPRVIQTCCITQPHHHVVASRIDIAVHDLAAVRAVLQVELVLILLQPLSKTQMAHL